MEASSPAMTIALLSLLASLLTYMLALMTSYISGRFPLQN
jgi:hypothetical protein